jgi:hypothetical protein
MFANAAFATRVGFASSEIEIYLFVLIYNRLIENTNRRVTRVKRCVILTVRKIQVGQRWRSTINDRFDFLGIHISCQLALNISELRKTY